MRDTFFPESFSAPKYHPLVFLARAKFPYDPDEPEREKNDVQKLAMYWKLEKSFSFGN